MGVRPVGFNRQVLNPHVPPAPTKYCPEAGDMCIQGGSCDAYTQSGRCGDLQETARTGDFGS
jgi:hypothetical protein